MSDGQPNVGDATTTPSAVWVIDTSSVLQIRREVPKLVRPTVLNGMTELVDAGALVFPREVLGELERGHGGLPKDSADEPLDWAKKNRDIAIRHGTDYAAVKAALETAGDVLDVAKVGGADEADPYVLGLALKLKWDGCEVTVVHQEIRDRPDKMSLSSACGLLRLYSLPLLPFLRDRGIWTP